MGVTNCWITNHWDCILKDVFTHCGMQFPGLFIPWTSVFKIAHHLWSNAPTYTQASTATLWYTNMDLAWTWRPWKDIILRPRKVTPTLAEWTLGAKMLSSGHLCNEIGGDVQTPLPLHLFHSMYWSGHPLLRFQSNLVLWLAVQRLVTPVNAQYRTCWPRPPVYSGVQCITCFPVVLVTAAADLPPTPPRICPEPALLWGFGGMRNIDCDTV